MTLANSITIQGAGSIGNGDFTLVNSGTVNANSSGLALVLNANSLGGVTNIGLLEATNNAILQISTVVNNSGGNINGERRRGAVELHHPGRDAEYPERRNDGDQYGRSFDARWLDAWGAYHFRRDHLYQPQRELSCDFGNHQ
jgi:hypothetical protein